MAKMAKNDGIIWIVVGLIAVFLVFTYLKPASTQSIYIQDSARIGDPDYQTILQQLSSIDRTKMMLKLTAQTVIGGATCSVNPDQGGDVTLNSSANTQVCYTNNAHTGLAFQLFKVTSTGYTFIGEKQLLRGASACFTGLAVGTYHWDFYYCDDTSSQTCSDSDGGINENTFGTVTITKSSGTVNTYSDWCNGELVMEEYCDSDNSLAGTNKACAAGKRCLNGVCDWAECATDANCFGAGGCHGTKKCVGGVLSSVCDCSICDNDGTCDGLTDGETDTSCPSDCKCDYDGTCDTGETYLVCGNDCECDSTANMCGTGESCVKGKCVVTPDCPYAYTKEERGGILGNLLKIDINFNKDTKPKCIPAGCAYFEEKQTTIAGLWTSDTRVANCCSGSIKESEGTANLDFLWVLANYDGEWGTCTQVDGICRFVTPVHELLKDLDPEGDFAQYYCGLSFGLLALILIPFIRDLMRG